ncbi:MAG: hypothetical protein KDD02_04760 [Phaeodactylibacter sp.]|nr:hypothetical protein [Phaeodactylibacter sp.]MCB9300177.1 hypothetical protein [Lewinellaceae bacterium]HQU58794.1 hypothetical protein [Saprospiraceae bacterium]
MALIKIFKVPKHQQYSYKPRYWDPQKEELHKRLKEVEERKGKSLDAVRARLESGGMRRGYTADTGQRQRQVLRSNLILVGIIVLLVLLSYLFLTIYLPEIAESVSGGGEIQGN